MAVRLTSASTEYLQRTTSLLNYNADYTWMAWVYLVSDLNAYQPFFWVGDSGTTHSDAISTGADGTTLSVYGVLGGGGGFVETTGSALSLTTWYHLALARSGNNLLAYLSGTLNITRACAVASRNAASHEIIGRDGPTGGASNIRVAHEILWSGVALSAAEIAVQSRRATPVVQRSSLFRWAPLWGTGAVQDYSGNGRTWTETNTPTTEDGPPAPWGGHVQPNCFDPRYTYAYPYADISRRNWVPVG